MNKEFVGILYTLGSDMPESEPMAFVQRMILQIRKHIPESGYLPTCSDRKPYIDRNIWGNQQIQNPNQTSK